MMNFSDWAQYDESNSVKMSSGFRLYLRKGCEYSRKRFIYKVAEKKELDFLTQFDFSELTCLDVGSNIGYWAIYLGNKLGAKQVHCFEPDPILFSILKKNISLNKIENNAFANQLAICEADKKIELYILPEHSGDNRPYFVENRASISVSGTTIDRYVKKNKINKVDFIKIDIQGGESAALDGCVETLSRDKPVLMLEFSPTVSSDGGSALRKKLINMTKSHNMSLFIIENNKLTSIEMNHLNHYDGNLFISTEKNWLCE